MRTLRAEGYLSEEVKTLMGEGLDAYGQLSTFDGTLANQPASDQSGDDQVLRPATDPFAPTGGLKILNGNLGQGVIKVSAVDPKHHIITAPAKIFDSQQAFLDAFAAGDLALRSCGGGAVPGP